MNIVPLPKYTKNWCVDVFSNDGLNDLIRYFSLWTITKSKFPRNNTLSLSIYNTSNSKMQFLNSKYRNKNEATNVLAFSSSSMPFEIHSHHLLGEIFFSSQKINDEANILQKKASNHLAHLIIHSTLHLLGYHHDDDEQKMKMQQKEIDILKIFEIDNPYCS